MTREQSPKAPQGSDQNYADDLIFYINGERVVVKHVDPTILLVDYLRSTAVGLTGTKKVRRHGGHDDRRHG